MTILALTWIVTRIFFFFFNSRLLGDQVTEMISWFLEISWMVFFRYVRDLETLIQTSEY